MRQQTNALFHLCCYLNACCLVHLDHLLYCILILLESNSLSADSLKDGRHHSSGLLHCILILRQSNSSTADSFKDGRHHSSGFKIRWSNLVLNHNFSSSFILTRVASQCSSICLLHKL